LREGQNLRLSAAVRLPDIGLSCVRAAGGADRHQRANAMSKTALNSPAPVDHQVVQLRRPGATVSAFARVQANTAPAGDGHDALSEALRAIRLTGSVFLNARLSGPFSITIRPDQFKATTPLAYARQVSMFHLIVSGSCILETEDGVRNAVSAGDLLLLPHAASHTFRDNDDDGAVDASDLVRQGAGQDLWTLEHGGGGETVRMICGFIDPREFLRAPLFRALPPLLIDRPCDDRVSVRIVSAAREIAQQKELATPATSMMLARLMEILLVEVLRRYASQQLAGPQGRLAALCDPIVGRTLQAIHRDPSRRWTVGDLAREARTSRSVLSERFSAMVGQPPIEYLANYRIKIASERLRQTDDCLAAVAADSGYESEAAFHRAFKRIAGVAPGRWRDADRRSVRARR
jgi:AraC-like DNA-binding protein